MAERDFKGVWIPKEIWLDTRLRVKEKFYLALYLENNRCIPIADLRIRPIVSSAKTLSEIKVHLALLGLIKTYSPQEAKDNVLAFKGLGQKCEWCGIYTISIQNHHFPIPKKDGGAKTVKICPNCHSEYHTLNPREMRE